MRFKIMAKVYPQLVREDTKYMRVDYEKLVAPLIESIREISYSA